MTIKLRQSTTSQEIPLGYFVDSTDGNTEETALTIANTDIKLWKMGATTLANKNSGGATHISNGIYYAVLDDTDTNTLGALVIFVHVAGALAIKVECEVLPANIYDSLIAGTDKLDINVEEWNATAVPAEHTAGYPIVTVKDGTGTGEIDTASGRVQLIESQIDQIVDETMDESLAAHTTTGTLGASVNTTLGVVNSVRGSVDGLIINEGVIGATGNDTTHIHLSTLTHGDDEINGQLLVIWDDSASESHARWVDDWVLATGLATVATLPFVPQASTDYYWLLTIRSDSGLSAAGVRAAVGLAAANLDTQLTAIDDAVDTETAAILADTNELQTDWANGGRLDLLIDAILADTGELQTDWVNGGRLDLLVDAIKVVTDAVNSAQAEPSGAPAANATPLEKLNYIFTALRNKMTISSSAKTFFNDAGASLWSKSLSDDGSTYTENEGV